MPLFTTRKRPNRPELQARLTSYDLPTGVQDKLFDFLEGAAEAELIRFNPRTLARRLGLTERETLNLLAVGFKENLFNLNWEVQCPVCHTNADYFNGPKDSHHHIQCVACSTNFDARFDEEVQITFTVHPAIRTLGQAQTVRLGVALPKSLDGALRPFSAHELLTVQAFRDFFKNESLPPGESFEVRRVTLLFTDLTGSTAMYVRKGDPLAYNLVREHFEVLKGVVEAEGGAIVKTIGDAVMAVFITEEAALRAAMAAQRQLMAFNLEHHLPQPDHLLLKIGLHAGPSIYVTLDERLDYFGTTINTAARVQGQAHSSEIVFTDQILDAPGVRDRLTGIALEETSVMLKGLTAPVRIWRLSTLKS